MLDDDTIANNRPSAETGEPADTGQDGGSWRLRNRGRNCHRVRKLRSEPSPACPSRSAIPRSPATPRPVAPAAPREPAERAPAASDGAFGGGIENVVAGTELLNDTVSGNTANGGNGYAGGGGIADDSIGMLIVNATIARNTAQASTGTTIVRRRASTMTATTTPALQVGEHLGCQQHGGGRDRLLRRRRPARRRSDQQCQRLQRHQRQRQHHGARPTWASPARWPTTAATPRRWPCWRAAPRSAAGDPAAATSCRLDDRSARIAPHNHRRNAIDIGAYQTAGRAGHHHHRAEPERQLRSTWAERDLHGRRQSDQPA